jgi:hypothetical protein
MHKTDTGSKPFSCQQCHRQFSRQDSLARHAKLHQQNARTSSRNLSALGTATSPPNTMSRSGTDASNGAPSLSAGTSESLHASPREATPTTLSQQSSTNHPLDSALEPLLEADMQLTWPDSEDLLQTILSSDLSSWTMPLDILPFPQYSPVAVQNTQLPLGLHESHDPSMDGGSQAVRYLSQMITTLVSHYKIMPDSKGLRAHKPHSSQPT